MQAPEGAALRDHYALAHQLGMSVSALLDLPAAELAGWRAYFATLETAHAPVR